MNWTLLHYCADRGFVSTLQHIIDILESDIDINVKSSTGDTPLHLAIKQFRFNMIKYLLYNGSWVDLKDSEGNTSRDLLWDAGLLYLIDNL